MRALKVSSMVFAIVGVTAVAQESPSTGTAQSGESILAISGDVATPLALTAADLAALPRTRVEVQHEGRTVAYEGVLVAELLRRAGVPLGRELRGEAVASYVLASARDGYRVVFSLAELDPQFTASTILIADTADGAPLPAEHGPLRVVAPRDARPARSVRMLERIEVVRLPGPGTAPH